jgi:hypothetical protein
VRGVEVGLQLLDVVLKDLDLLFLLGLAFRFILGLLEGLLLQVLVQFYDFLLGSLWDEGPELVSGLSDVAVLAELLLALFGSQD